MSTDKSDDSVLDEYLKGDSRLSRLYRDEATEGPPAELDARIRAEAKRAAARPRLRVVHGPFSRHWMVPASLAAVVVLSVSVILLIPDPGLEQDIAGRKPAPATTLEAPPRGDVVSNYAQPPPARGGGLGTAKERLASEPAPPAEAAGATPAEPASAGQREAGSLADRDVPAMPSPAQEFRRQSLRRRAAAPLEEESPQPISPAGASSEGTTRAADEISAEPARALAREERAASEAKDKLEEERSSEVQDAPIARVAPGVVAPKRARPDSDPDPAPPREVQADPRRWMAFIEELLEDDDTEGARSNLRAFRLRYPGEPLAGELARLAEDMDAEEPGAAPAR